MIQNSLKSRTTVKNLNEICIKQAKMNESSFRKAMQDTKFWDKSSNINFTNNLEAD